MRTWYWLALVGITAAFGCKGTRQIQTVINKVDSASVVSVATPEIDSSAVKDTIISRVNSHYIDFMYFFGKVKIDFADSKGKNTNATAFVRMRKDSAIWISITGALGIEGFRILVKPDSVYVMDKLEKTIASRRVEYLQEVVKLPLDFTTLQDIVLGNPIYFNRNIVSFRFQENTLMALSVSDYFKHLLTIDTASNHVVYSKLDDVDELRNRTCGISFLDFTKIQDRNFSNRREITVAEKSKLDIKLEFKQVTFDERQTFPFNIPKNYTPK
jgi:hypothetical protein